MKDQPTIIFDLGNVLVLFDIRITCRGFSKYSPFSPDVIAKKIFGQRCMIDFETGRISGEEFYHFLCKNLEMEIDREEFKEIWSQMFWENTPTTTLLKVLLKRYQVLLLSNTNSFHFVYCWENYPFLQFLDDFILSYKTGYMKPDPAIYRIAAEKADTTPIIYIDDKLEFASAASENGLIGIHFQSPQQLREDLLSHGIYFNN
jgi:FMN phosphatase YigB (HAD superfamily)